MGILNKRHEDDDELPGSSGLHVDLEQRICPQCRTEALPWQDACERCGATPVPPSQLPPSGFALPAHLLEGLDDEPSPSDEGTSEAGDPDAAGGEDELPA